MSIADGYIVTHQRLDDVDQVLGLQVTNNFILIIPFLDLLLLLV